MLKFWIIYIETVGLELVLGALCSCRFWGSSVLGLLRILSQLYGGGSLLVLGADGEKLKLLVFWWIIQISFTPSLD